jgi:hypothetical protein
MADHDLPEAVRTTAPAAIKTVSTHPDQAGRERRAGPVLPPERDLDPIVA